LDQASDHFNQAESCSSTEERFPDIESQLLLPQSFLHEFFVLSCCAKPPPARTKKDILLGKILRVTGGLVCSFCIYNIHSGILAMESSSSSL
jgi:hypothetical protein